MMQSDSQRHWRKSTQCCTDCRMFHTVLRAETELTGVGEETGVGAVQNQKSDISGGNIGCHG